MKSLPSRWTIQEVSDRLQLPKSTLRFWEREFDGIILPERTAGGQRRYTERDVALLAAIDDQKKEGLSLTQIKQRLLREQLSDNGRKHMDIDRLAEYIAGAVRREIYNYFAQQES